MADRISIVIVDDHDLVREGLRSLLTQYEDFAVVGEAADVETAVRVIERTTPDLVLLDLRLGEADGVEVARRVRGLGRSVTILVLSAQDSAADLRSALAAGADGYLLKSVKGSELADGIRNAVAGQTVIGHEFVPKLLADARRPVPSGDSVLTHREQEVLELVAEGLGNRAVADRLGMSTRTAQKHMENLFRKLDVHDRTGLVSAAFRRGLIN